MAVQITVWLPCLLGLLSGLVAALWMVRISRPDAIAPETSPELIEAMREVDAMLPGSPPISPGIRNVNGPWPAPPEPPILAVERRAIEAAEKRQRRLMREGAAELARLTGRLDLTQLVPPEAEVAEVWPRCTGAGGCGYHHRKGIPCGQALNERRPPPPAPMPTPAPGPGIKGSR